VTGTGTAVATDADDRRAGSGELALVGAVLERAVRDARAGRRDARAWLASDATGGGPGWTYADACAVLGLDPSWGRALVAAGGRARRPSMKGPGRLRAAA